MDLSLDLAALRDLQWCEYVVQQNSILPCDLRAPCSSDKEYSTLKQTKPQWGCSFRLEEKVQGLTMISWVIVVAVNNGKIMTFEMHLD